MKITEYRGRKNDLLINLISRWIMTDVDKTIIITLNKCDGGVNIQQWAMDSDGNDIDSFTLLTTPFKKKFYAIQEVDKMIRQWEPNWKVYQKS